MLWIFKAVSDRVKAMFVTDAALDFESQMIRRQADRKAELLLKAQELDEQGLESVAAELRERAERVSLENPLAAALPAASVLHEQAPQLAFSSRDETPSIPSLPSSSNGSEERPSGATRKKTAKRRRVPR